MGTELDVRSEASRAAVTAACRLYVMLPQGLPGTSDKNEPIRRLQSKHRVYRPTQNRDHDFEFMNVNLDEWCLSMERKALIIDREELAVSSYLVLFLDDPHAVSLPLLVELGRADAWNVPIVAVISRDAPYFQPCVIEAIDVIFTQRDELYAFFGV